MRAQFLNSFLMVLLAPAISSADIVAKSSEFKLKQKPNANVRSTIKSGEGTKTTGAIDQGNTNAAQINGREGSALNPTTRQNYYGGINNIVKAEKKLGQFVKDKHVKKDDAKKIVQILAAKVDTTAGLGKNRPTPNYKKPFNVKASSQSNGNQVNVESGNVEGMTGLSTLYVPEEEISDNTLERSFIVDGDGNQISLNIDNSESGEEATPEEQAASNGFSQKIARIAAVSQEVGAPAGASQEERDASLSFSERPISIHPSRGLASQEEGVEEDVELDEEEEGLFTTLMQSLLGEEDEEIAAGDEAYVADEDLEPPFTIYSGKLKKKNKKAGTPEAVEVGTYTGNSRGDEEGDFLMTAGRKVPTFMEDMAERALQDEGQLAIILWALIGLGLLAIFRLAYGLQKAPARPEPRNLGIVIPFRDPLLRHHRSYSEPAKDDSWESRQGSVSVKEVSEIKDAPELSIGNMGEFTDSNWKENTLITETTRVTGAIAPWTPIKDRKLSPKRFYIRKDKKSRKWHLVQTDLKGNIARTIGEVAAGTVVDGRVLGQHFSARRYKLNTQGHWYPTADKPSLVLTLNKKSGQSKSWS